MIFPVTVALLASLPDNSFFSSLCTARTEPKVTFSPTSPLTRSIRIVSPGATRYCFPPVLMTANIVPPSSKTNPDYRGQLPVSSTQTVATDWPPVNLSRGGGCGPPQLFAQFGV